MRYSRNRHAGDNKYIEERFFTVSNLIVRNISSHFVLMECIFNRTSLFLVLFYSNLGTRMT